MGGRGPTQHRDHARRRGLHLVPYGIAGRSRAAGLRPWVRRIAVRCVEQELLRAHRPGRPGNIVDRKRNIVGCRGSSGLEVTEHEHLDRIVRAVGSGDEIDAIRAGGNAAGGRIFHGAQSFQ